MTGKAPVKAVPLYGAVLAALVFSVIFIALHADHDCSRDEYCPVCLQLHAAMERLKYLGPAAARLLGGLGLWGAAAGLLKFFSPLLTKPTSVSLKVRLNI
ncbi:MAG: hypothetical protein LBL28_05470 [Treponema sp.]|jgi:hypothetical protein|nr:hypothetical protein [Treponema sp.]